MSSLSALDIVNTSLLFVGARRSLNKDDVDVVVVDLVDGNVVNLDHLLSPPRKLHLTGSLLAVTYRVVQISPKIIATKTW